MEKRHFIHIAQTYAPKNKLAAEIQDAILSLDGTLFPSRQTANKEINKRFMATCQDYIKSGGKAFLPDFKEYDITRGFAVQVSECIIIHAYLVTEEID